MSNLQKPIIGITMGDPAGIGPEICAHLFEDTTLYENSNCFVVGDASCIQHAIDKITKSCLKVNPLTCVKDAKFTPGCIDVYDLANVDMSKLRLGQVSKNAGNAAFEYVKKVIDLALSKEVDATVTAPINKEALNEAGHHFSGHTEIYAHYTNTKKYAMMLVHDKLRVIHVSTHVSLRQACDMVKKERVEQVISLADEVLRQMGINEPLIAVAGLNPHAGENGMFGKEELEEIQPAVESSNNTGMKVIGPIPPDTVFSKAAGGLYDVVIAMYHDQGHIPIKMAGFKYGNKNTSQISGINITLGLPIIRVSVDHGTAFDIAGKNIASPNSLRESVDYAIRLVKGKK